MASKNVNNNQKFSKATAVVFKIGLLLKKYALRRKKLTAGVIILLIIASFYYFKLNSNTTDAKDIARKEVVEVEKNYDFEALDNNGSPTEDRIKFSLSNAEKTNQVIVQEKVFTAKNNKKFLIINLKLRNDKPMPLNIYPGNLIRLTYNGDEETRYAPDLHNNLVQISPLSTKIDRVGFVIPEEVTKYNLYIGELEGDKEVVSVEFNS